MNLDAGAKRLFPAIVLGMVATAAYFQASGVGEIVASNIASGTDPSAAPPASPLASPASKGRDGQPILARNPFDSVTGPLDGEPDDEGEGGGDAAEEEPTEGEPEAEDGDPKCGFGRVVLIAAAEDPAWSFASIAGKDGDVQIRRVGDDVDGHVVAAMAWDRVWLKQGTKRCQIAVGEAAEAPPPATKSPASSRSRRGRRTPKLDPELASKINKVSDTEFTIERSVVDEILAKQAELMRFARMRPVKEGDKVVGLRLSRVQPGTLLDVIGLKNGDQVQSINGFELTDPQKALEAYGRLSTANKLTLTVTRGGKPMSIDYAIQ